MQKGKSMATKEKKMGTMKEILALHGWTITIEKWGAFVTQMAKLGIRIKILLVPGLTKKITKVWTLEDYVDWLKKQVGTKRVILLGHSNGGRIALAFAVKYPNCVSKLILIDSAGIYHDQLPLKMKRFLFRGVAKLGKKIIPSENLRNILYKLTRESDYKNATPLQRQIMVNLISLDLTPILKKIKTPTLIIWGQNDKTTPLADGKLMHKLIKNSKLEILKGSGHSPHYTKSGKVAKIINEYL